MFGKIAAFELRYQLKSPVFWVATVIVFLLTYGSVTIDEIQIGATSNVHVNSPAALINVCLVFSLFFMFLSTALVANVVVRDDDTGFGSLGGGRAGFSGGSAGRPRGVCDAVAGP